METHSRSDSRCIPKGNEPNVTEQLEYRNYWERKELLIRGAPPFPVKRWWESESLSDADEIILDAVKNAGKLLDVGAGDFRVKRKLELHGFSGLYHTQDIGEEFTYTYRSLDEVDESYDAILCLDVIEHLSLQDGLALLSRLTDLLSPDGKLVIQTPNARCIRSPLGWDMTHLHCYNGQDLWAFLSQLDLAVNGYRIVFGSKPKNPFALFRFALGAFVASRVLGCDYADNLLLIAQRGNQPD